MTALAILMALICACPHDFSREPGDIGGPDVAHIEAGVDLAADLSTPDLYRVPDLEPHDTVPDPDLLPTPDAGCPLPCVSTIADGFTGPADVAVGANVVYVADEKTCIVYQIQMPGGSVTAFAGDGTSGSKDGPALTAQFAAPVAMAMAGNDVIVADMGNHRIRVISNGVVSTLAGSTPGFNDGLKAAAQFHKPAGVAVDGKGEIYVADMENHRIRVVSPAGQVTTLAGDGTAGYVNGSVGVARFNAPTGVAADGAGHVFVADRDNQAIRLINVSTGQVVTLAGDGTSGYKDGVGDFARFDKPLGIAVANSKAYVADYKNHRIRVVDSGWVTTLAGSGGGLADGPASSAKFHYPQGVAVDSTGKKVYVADFVNGRVRLIQQ